MIWRYCLSWAWVWKKDRSKQTMQQVGHKSMYIQFINQDSHNQPCVINSNFLVLKFIFKSPNFANDLHILNINVTTGLEQECFTYTSFQFLWHYENRECSWTGFHDHSVISCWVPVQQEICNDCQSYSKQSVTDWVLINPSVSQSVRKSDTLFLLLLNG